MDLKQIKKKHVVIKVFSEVQYEKKSNTMGQDLC